MSQSMILQEKIPSDVELDIKLYGKYLSFLRRHPTHAVRILWGIIVPPHEARILEACWLGYRTNVIKCSRGTSKTFTVGSLFAPTKALLTRGKAILVASASKFRGGKTVLKDSSRLLRGSLKSQKVGNNWGVHSLVHRNSAVKKEPDMWSIEFKSNSFVYTIPTNNQEATRGLRADILIVDETNTFEWETLQKIYLPFLAVGSDFENPAEGSEGNQIFYVGTIDYTYREFYKQIQAIKDIAKIQYEVNKAMRKGDWGTYDRLRDTHDSRLSTASFNFIRYDYTDLIIPTQIGNYKVSYPGAVQGKQIKYDNRDKKDYIYTYPINKKQLEDPLDEGTIDLETWRAEQRNVFIETSGNLFDHNLIEKVTGPVYTLEEERKRKWNAEEEGERYLPPVLYECSDPCVLGVDVARTSDFSAFVVIRLGDLPTDFFLVPKSDYGLNDHSGPTPWSNVIWAEQHQKMTVKEVADHIRELRSRYNIIATRNLPGVSMDARGGGVNVRDELVNPSAPIDDKTGQVDSTWKKPQIIFDPDDKEEKFGKELLADSSGWPGLKLLWTTDFLNQELVGFARAQMQTGKLYLGTYKPKRQYRDPENKLYLGYIGVQTLKHQLLRVQAVSPHPGARSVRYEMPGDHTKIENKRDMFFAFLYACNSAREWLTDKSKKMDHIMPITYGTIIKIPGGLYG